MKPKSAWFEMQDIRRRSYATAVWVPLRVAEITILHGEPHTVGVVEDFVGAGCVAFPQEKRSLAESLGWMDLGLNNSGGPYAFRNNSYKPCEVYQHHDGENDGVDLVFVQHFNRDHPNIWHLSQDLIMALGLLEEDDAWVRPDEAYVVVARRRRDSEGQVVAIEIRGEHLRDYLAARGLALRLASYRQRTAILEDASYLGWPEEGLQETQPHERFEGRIMDVDERGAPYGGGVAVFQMWRTDVDEGADVPVFERENDDNTAGRSFSFERGGPKFARVDGELWREEWIEPADRSVRVRGDDSAEQFTYAVDVAGTREAGANLNHEDIGRYLWFSPRVIGALEVPRGAGLSWYTEDTGSVWCSPGYHTHFGVNGLGLVNVYAYDVAKLPFWQQRIWAGHNVAPDGQVSAELLASQQLCEPASTSAPEADLIVVMDELDAAFLAWSGETLFQAHDAAQDILRRVHRFRATDRNGLLELAKDLARLLVDRIQIGTLRRVILPPKGENWGSLKSIEKAVATVVPADRARSLLTPLVGMYELRLGDAHLPSQQLRDAFALAGLDPEAEGIEQGKLLIAAAVSALRNIQAVVPRTPLTA